MNTINKIISIVIALIATINIYAQKNIMDIHVYPQVSAGKTKQCIVTLVNQTNDSIAILNGFYPNYNSEVSIEYLDNQGNCIDIDNAYTNYGYIFTNHSNEKHPAVLFISPQTSTSFAFQYGERVDFIARKKNIKKIKINITIKYNFLSDTIDFTRTYHNTFESDYWNSK